VHDIAIRSGDVERERPSVSGAVVEAVHLLFVARASPLVTTWRGGGGHRQHKNQKQQQHGLRRPRRPGGNDMGIRTLSPEVSWYWPDTASASASTTAWHEA
jgi:hypothetical protein